MSKQTITNGESGLITKNKLNDNFTELYTGAETVAATDKPTPVDADVLPVQDSAASNIKKKVTWANIKATLKTYLDALYATAAQGTTADAALPSASYTAADVLTKIKTVDGTGSGLDADLLDGNQATAFATAAQGAKADSATQPADLGNLAPLDTVGTSEIDAGAVNNARLADMATKTYKGRTLAGTGQSQDVPVATLKTDLSLDNVPNLKQNLVATTAPGVGNDNTQGYAVGSGWYDVTADKAYSCLDITTGAAVWIETTGSGGGGVPTSRMIGDADLVDDITTTELRRMVFKPSESVLPLVSDFVGGVAPYEATNSGSGTAITFPAFAGEQGVARTQKGTTATGRAWIGTSSNNILETGLGEMIFEEKLKIDTLSDATDDYIAYSGFLDGLTAESVDGMYFRYNHGVNSGNWQAICRNTSTETAVDTGVAGSTTAVKLRIVANAAGTSVVFSIDGAVVATITTNIPTGNRTYGVYTGIRSTAGTTTRIIDHFYMLFMNLLTPGR